MMYVRNACLNKIWNILCVLPVLPIFKVVLDTYFRSIFPNYSFWRYTCVCDTALFIHMYFYEQQQFSHHIIIIIITIIRKTTGCSQYLTVSPTILSTTLYNASFVLTFCWKSLLAYALSVTHFAYKYNQSHIISLLCCQSGQKLLLCYQSSCHIISLLCCQSGQKLLLCYQSSCHIISL